MTREERHARDRSDQTFEPTRATSQPKIDRAELHESSRCPPAWIVQRSSATAIPRIAGTSRRMRLSLVLQARPLSRTSLRPDSEAGCAMPPRRQLLIRGSQIAPFPKFSMPCTRHGSSCNRSPQVASIECGSTDSFLDHRMPQSRGTLAETRKLHNSHVAENRGDTEIRPQPNATAASPSSARGRAGSSSMDSPNPRPSVRPRTSSFLV